MYTKRGVLESLTIGADVAEHELDSIQRYFVETDQWRKISSGEVDIVYGTKGAGKSAIYFLLLKQESLFFDRNILLAAAENTKSDPAFAQIKDDAPPSEQEFVGIWKLYLCSVASLCAKEYGVASDHLDDVLKYLRDVGVHEGWSLNRILRVAKDYVRRFFNPEEIEPTISVDPATATPTVSCRITFTEPSRLERDRGSKPISDLTEKLDRALRDSGFTLWLLLDRLDVAFAASAELEMRALRALFRAYSDMSSLTNLKLKIFLRSDIWTRITIGGFREATHVASPAKSTTLKWTQELLFHVAVRRLVENQALVAFYNVDKAEIVADAQKQAAFFKRLAPEKIDTGKNPDTFGWIYGRIKDGQGVATPRELVQFMSELRNIQLQKLERGEQEPLGEFLFERSSFKEALPAVSENRLQKTIYAEYGELRKYIEALSGARSRQTLDTLCDRWQIFRVDAVSIINDLVKIGFLKSYR